MPRDPAAWASSATIAKRRSYANTISYLTPPAENAGLYKGLKELKELISSYQGLRDGGAEHYVQCITRTRELSPKTQIEVLVPDFRGRLDKALDILARGLPDVMNHNLETVPRLYKEARPGSDYMHSLKLLKDFKALYPHVKTKSGIMVGLGEEKEEVLQVMDDMRAANVDFLTIGQYLQPTPRHAAVERFVTPDEFKSYELIAQAKGFLLVSASPLTRSSYHADADFARLKAARVSSLGGS